MKTQGSQNKQKFSKLKKFFFNLKTKNREDKNN